MTSTAVFLPVAAVEEAALDGDAMSIAIVERADELAAIREFLESVGTRPATLLLTGDIGIGKSTLWNGGLELADALSYHVLASRPVESETTLPFAALGDLFETLPDDTFLPLPIPQRRALMAALLRTEAEESRFHQRAVALGALATLRMLAVGRPVLLAIDDIQWLDRASAQVIEFALRRLEDEPVGALLSSRVDADTSSRLELESAMPPDRVRELVLSPLDNAAIDKILEQKLGLTLSRREAASLRQGSAGNPYYALELARALARQRSDDRAGSSMPIPRSLRELARERIGRLPAETRELALVVSALSQPRMEILDRALGDAAPELDRLADAQDAGVLELDGDTVRFTHPLLSSVLYSDAPRKRRRQLHKKLADLLDDPEERARHLALAIEEPDASVADELEQAARIARGRGAPESAAELVEKARSLTPPDHRETIALRCILAADYHFEAGHTAKARTLLEQALAISTSGSSRARALVPLAWTVVTEQGFRHAAPLFDEAAAQAGDDLRVQIEARRGLSWCEQHDGHLPAAAEHARAAAELASELGDPGRRGSSLADVAFLEFLMGEGFSDDALAEAIELERESGSRLGIMGRPSWISGLILEFAGELDRARSMLDEHYTHALETGDEQAVPFILNHLSRIDLLSGDWSSAARRSETAYQATLESAQEIERVFALTTRALVAACLGDAELAEETAGEALRTGERLHSKPAVFEALFVLGFLELSLGNLAGAVEIYERLAPAVRESGFGEPLTSFRFHADEIEVLIGLGRLDDAERRLVDLERVGRSLDRPWAAATARRCRGLLLATRGNAQDALEELDRALVEHDRLAEPLERARTLLVRGVVARRDRQKAVARENLEAALDTFESLGARLWVERAREELKRIGGRESDGSGLTPTEERIAALVSEGLSNKEVAATLFVSPKTIEWNLTKIYKKLDVRSRGQLASRLRNPDTPSS